jgi:hypothetical protein
VRPLRKYQLLLAGTMALFLYILVTEIADRYGELWKAYRDLEMKKETVSDPETLSDERSRLLAHQKKLKDLLHTQTGSFEPSGSGVLEFVNVSATKAQVKIESLVPQKPESRAHDQLLAFTLSCRGPVHKVGLFLNQLESGPFSLHVSKLEVTREGAGASSVKARIEGVVHLTL